MKILRKISHTLRQRKINQLKLLFGSVGENVQLQANKTFACPENIYLGSNIYIGPNAYVFADGGVTIRDNVIIGPNVTILTSNHRYENGDALPYDGTTLLRHVVIRENVWVGANVSIAPGVEVGEGAVIAMGAVVTKDVPKGAVIGGNPARIIKYRDLEKYEALKCAGMFYIKLKSEGKVVWERIHEK